MQSGAVRRGPVRCQSRGCDAPGVEVSDWCCPRRCAWAGLEPPPKRWTGAPVGRAGPLPEVERLATLPAPDKARAVAADHELRAAVRARDGEPAGTALHAAPPGPYGPLVKLPGRSPARCSPLRTPGILSRFTATVSARVRIGMSPSGLSVLLQTVLRTTPTRRPQLLGGGGGTDPQMWVRQPGPSLTREDAGGPESRPQREDPVTDPARLERAATLACCGRTHPYRVGAPWAGSGRQRIGSASQRRGRSGTFASGRRRANARHAERSVSRTRVQNQGVATAAIDEFRTVGAR